MARRRKYGELAWRGDASRQIVPRSDIGTCSPNLGSKLGLRPALGEGLGRPLTPGEIEVWRGLSGAQSAAGQEPDLAELARQRHEAASSAILRRMRQSWADRETGDA
jgi:hypothetical protein